MNMEGPQYSYKVGKEAEKEIAQDKQARAQHELAQKNAKSAEQQQRFDALKVGDFVTIKSPANGELSDMKVVKKENGELSLGPRSETGNYTYSIGMKVEQMDEIIDSYTPKN
ncbi:MAG: hypothetical protein WCG55_04300 [bacterium]